MARLQRGPRRAGSGATPTSSRAGADRDVTAVPVGRSPPGNRTARQRNEIATLNAAHDFGE